MCYAIILKNTQLTIWKLFKFSIWMKNIYNINNNDHDFLQILQIHSGFIFQFMKHHIYLNKVSFLLADISKIYKF